MSNRAKRISPPFIRRRSEQHLDSAHDIKRPPSQTPPSTSTEYIDDNDELRLNACHSETNSQTIQNTPHMKMTVHPDPTQPEPTSNAAVIAVEDLTTTPTAPEVVIDSIPHPSKPDSLPSTGTSDASTRLTSSTDEGLTLSWSGISFSVPMGKKLPDKEILKGMDGCAKPGEVVAILGGSGAGKTTLLNYLSGRVGVGTMKGEVLVNGMPRKKAAWRRTTGFVEQIEVMYQNLTVKETLTYAARLRLPSSIPESDKAERVQSVIAELGLTNCQNTRIGDSEVRGISGGEKKRVSIGIELVTNPKILFLDEPTSGLDAFTAVNIVSTISNVAKNPQKKTTVIMTIHQPRTDILQLCDKILLLAGGRTVFFGPLEEALTFFAKLEYPLPPQTNPSDHFLDVVTLDQRSPELQAASMTRIELFANAWEMEKRDSKKMIEMNKLNALDADQDGQVGRLGYLSHSGKYNSSWLTQFWILLGRNMVDVLRDTATIGATVGQGAIIAIVMGFIFFQLNLEQAGVQNRIGALFFIVVNQTFGTVMPGIVANAGALPIIRRERSAGTYSASAAYLAKFISSIPLTLIGSLLLALPVYWMMGLQRDAGRYLTFLVIVLVHSFTAMALGIMIGSGVRNVRVGQVIGPLVVVLFLIFGGQVLNLDSVPVVFRWIQWISIISYSNKALSQNEFPGLVFNCQPNGPCYKTGEQVLEVFAYTNPNGIWTCVGINLALAAAFTMLGYVLFRRTSKPLMRLG
ncbi:hypothetical protein HDV05_000398 [Chytridiales sp. JEL 0842]|nr:hypothetical protein HDV05_000398 [Chytridiales sp. JEL 0842]